MGGTALHPLQQRCKQNHRQQSAQHLKRQLNPVGAKVPQHVPHTGKVKYSPACSGEETDSPICSRTVRKSQSSCCVTAALPLSSASVAATSSADCCADAESVTPFPNPPSNPPRHPAKNIPCRFTSSPPSPFPAASATAEAPAAAGKTVPTAPPYAPAPTLRSPDRDRRRFP